MQVIINTSQKYSHKRVNFHGSDQTFTQLTIPRSCEIRHRGSPIRAMPNQRGSVVAYISVLRNFNHHTLVSTWTLRHNITDIASLITPFLWLVISHKTMTSNTILLISNLLIFFVKHYFHVYAKVLYKHKYSCAKSMKIKTA